jgi:peptidoglycan/xylan/chitin deacetylase (PgdA/CDA1 family)
MISIMFHSAGLNKLAWRSAHVSEPLDIIRDKLEMIHQEGYESLFMREAAEHIGEKHDRLVHLNFDDGYLDNWVHIFPLLEKFRLKATVYVTAEFVDPGETVRRRSDSSEREHDPAGCCAGFLSYREMREMEASGLVEIQSHSLTHTWYFKGPAIVDFWRPGAATRPLGPVWMLWNDAPDRKPFYLTEAAGMERNIPYGTPIYEHGKSLETLRYFPDEDVLAGKLIEKAESEGDGFFERPGWREELIGIVRDYRRGRGTRGEYESADAHARRISVELSESKSRIEEGLAHRIDGICWPGGGVTEQVVLTAKEIGYRYFTLPSAWRNAPRNRYFEEMIPRIGSLTRITLKGRDLGYATKRDFKYHMRYHNGQGLARIMLGLGKIGKLLLGS